MGSQVHSSQFPLWQSLEVMDFLYMLLHLFTSIDKPLGVILKTSAKPH